MCSWWNYLAILWPASLSERCCPLQYRNFSVHEVPLINCCFYCLAVAIPFRKSFPLPMSSRLFLIFVLYIWFYIKSLWFTWVMLSAGWYRFIYIILHATVQLLKIVSYFYCEFLDFLNKKSGVHRCVDLCLCLQFKAMHQCICFYDNFIQFLLL